MEASKILPFYFLLLYIERKQKKRKDWWRLEIRNELTSVFWLCDFTSTILLRNHVNKYKAEEFKKVLR